MLLICAFVFAYAKSRFSRDASHIVTLILSYLLIFYLLFDMFDISCLIETLHLHEITCIN